MQIAMIQDQIVPFDEVDSALLDRGTFFGDGVYEVIRSYNGRIFALDDHLERFARSLKEIKITGVDIEGIRERIEKAFDEAKIDDAKIYFHITRGSAVRNHATSEKLTPNFFMTITEIEDTANEKLIGIKVSTFPDWRWKRCDIKSLNLLANVLAKTDAAKKGCGEAILVNDDNKITEGSASAFFAIIGDDLIVHPLGMDILPSITRKVILKIAHEAGLKPVEKRITPDEAANADELFIAVTTKDVVPVIEFDNKTIGNGKPGRHTKTLIEKFAQFIKSS